MQALRFPRIASARRLAMDGPEGYKGIVARQMQQFKRTQDALGGAPGLRQPRDHFSGVFGRSRWRCHAARLTPCGAFVTAANRFTVRVFRLGES